jgi:hypothetical protein
MWISLPSNSTDLLGWGAILTRFLRFVGLINMLGSIFSTFEQIVHQVVGVGLRRCTLVAAVFACSVLTPGQARPESAVTSPVHITAPTLFSSAPATIVVPITVSDITGNGIIAFQFHLLYDPAIVNPSGPNFGCSTAGTISGTAGMTATCNVAPGDAGRLQVAVSGANALPGPGTALKLTFVTHPSAQFNTFSLLTFQNVFFYNLGGEFANVPHNGRITLIGPTAADVSVSGRIINSEGRGVTNATVTVRGGSLAEPRVISTGRSGSYSFAGLVAGETYVITVAARRYAFASSTRVVSMLGDLTDVDFVAERP